MKWFGDEDPPPTLSDKIFGGFTSYPNIVRRFRFLLVLLIAGVLLGVILRFA